MSVAATIIKGLQKFAASPEINPDSKHNTGRSIGEYYLWTTVMNYADSQRENALKSMVKEGIVKGREELDPGEHHLADSPAFVMMAKVSNPIRRFDTDTLAELFRSSKFKVPEPVTKEFVEKAKIPGKPSVTYKVIERS